MRWDLGTINFLLDRNLDSFFSILFHAVENQNDLRFIPADGKTLLSFSSTAENLPSETTPRTGDVEGLGTPQGWSWGAPDLWYSGLPTAQLPHSTSDPPCRAFSPCHTGRINCFALIIIKTKGKQGKRNPLHNVCRFNSRGPALRLGFKCHRKGERGRLVFTSLKITFCRLAAASAAFRGVSERPEAPPRESWVRGQQPPRPGGLLPSAAATSQNGTEQLPGPLRGGRQKFAAKRWDLIWRGFGRQRRPQELQSPGSAPGIEGQPGRRAALRAVSEVPRAVTLPSLPKRA